MPEGTADQSIHTINFTKEQKIDAPIEIVFQAVLDELGPEGMMPGDKPLPMKLEAFPGGRWYRDTGKESGHLWGHVQVIKPPGLLELYGPMPMSYPGMNHLQYKLTADGAGTRLKFTHQAMGLIPKEHREGMQEGWSYGLKRIVELAMKRKGAAR